MLCCLTRVPAPQNSQELQAIFRVLQHLWQRHYQGLWQALAYSWSPPIQLFMSALAEKTRHELMDLISTAYSSVKPAKIASICGLTEQDAASGM